MNTDITNRNNSPIDPCSHWYPGNRAFQSPEVDSIANWVSTLRNVIGFIDLRSYGQMGTLFISVGCLNKFYLFFIKSLYRTPILVKKFRMMLKINWKLLWVHLSR